MQSCFHTFHVHISTFLSLQDEIFAETGVVIPPDAEPSSRESDMFSAFDETSQHSNSSHPTPASTPVFNNSNRVARASTSQYAKKRKISLNQDDELKMDIKPAKVGDELSKKLEYFPWHQIINKIFYGSIGACDALNVQCYVRNVSPY